MDGIYLLILVSTPGGESPNEPVGFPLKSPSNFVLLDEIQVRANLARYQTLLDNAQIKISTWFSTSTCGNSKLHGMKFFFVPFGSIPQNSLASRFQFLNFRSRQFWPIFQFAIIVSK